MIAMIDFKLKDNTILSYSTEKYYYFHNYSGIWLKEKADSVFEIGIDPLTRYRAGHIQKIVFRKINIVIEANKPILRVESNKPGCCAGIFVETIFTPWKIEILSKFDLTLEDLNINERHVITDSPPLYRVKSYNISPFQQLPKNHLSSISILIPPNSVSLLKKRVMVSLKKLNLSNQLFS